MKAIVTLYVNGTRLEVFTFDVESREQGHDCAKSVLNSWYTNSPLVPWMLSNEYDHKCAYMYVDSMAIPYTIEIQYI